MKKLPDITLIALGTTQIEGMQKALDYSCRDIEWGAVKLITEVPCNSIDEWNHAIVYDLWKFVDTSHALLIHPDGFVVNPDSWRDEFLEYDYIGAPWPLPTDDFSYRDEVGNIVRVGNSVGLRSRKLLKLPTDLGLEWREFYGNTNEDGFFCCHHKKTLEAHGCRFAEIDVAKHFSRELPLPENEGITPFCFHRNIGENREYPNFEV